MNSINTIIKMATSSLHSAMTEEDFVKTSMEILETASPISLMDIYALFEQYVTSDEKVFKPEYVFSDDKLTLFMNDFFIIELNLWQNNFTTIHGHGFFGAFKIVHGKAMQQTYAFKGNAYLPDCKSVEEGELSTLSRRILGASDAPTAICSGDEFIHNLVHFNNPTATLIIRTIGGLSKEIVQRDFIGEQTCIATPVSDRGHKAYKHASRIRFLTALGEPCGKRIASSINAVPDDLLPSVLSIRGVFAPLGEVAIDSSLLSSNKRVIMSAFKERDAVTSNVSQMTTLGVPRVDVACYYFAVDGKDLDALFARCHPQLSADEIDQRHANNLKLCFDIDGDGADVAMTALHYRRKGVPKFVYEEAVSDFEGSIIAKLFK